MATTRAAVEHPAPQGQMLVLFALTLAVFIGAAMIGVDLAHLRAEAERTQHAANAAALAGIVYMPDYPNQASYQASAEATKNGFTTNAAKGMTVTPLPAPGGNINRLKVTVSERVSLFFGALFGLGKQSIGRSATAEFLPALQLGSPDYVLGIPVFPSFLTSTDGISRTSLQNFYLNQNGQYAYKEFGDPYSPFFESFSPSGKYDPSGAASDINPCSNQTLCNTNPPHTGPTPVPNAATTNDTGAPVPAGGANFHGYRYVITIPDTSTVLVKLFDPFSEINYNGLASCWDKSLQPLTSRSCSSTAVARPVAPIAPADISPVGSSGCTLGGTIGSCHKELIDSTQGGGTTFSGGSSSYAETTLNFSLSGSTQSLLDPALWTKAISLTPSGASSPQCLGATENCVISAPFLTGNDLTTCDAVTCTASQVAYKFINYAILHGNGNGPTYFGLSVASNQNTENSTYGESGNAYGLAVCNAQLDATWPISGGPLGTVGNYVTSDPISQTASTTGTWISQTNGWNSSSCISPDNSTMCPNPRIALPSQCAQIAAVGALPLVNILSAGSSLIPLGYIPPGYAGHTIRVDLFDPGDIQGSGATPSSVFGCLTPPTPIAGGPPPINSIELLTPAGDLACPGGNNHIDGNPNTVSDPLTTTITNVQPSSLPYSFNAAPDLTNTGYANTAPSSANADTPLDVGNGTKPFNGTWVHLQVTIPDTYSSMVNGTSVNSVPDTTTAFGGYWKVLYRVGGNANDGTTWRLSVEGSYVHLVNDNSP